MAKVVAGTRQRVVVKKTGHPAAFGKIRCPHCRVGYAVSNNLDPMVYVCERCARKFKRQAL